MKKITKLLIGTLVFAVLLNGHTPGLNAALVALVFLGLLSVKTGQRAGNPLSTALFSAVCISALSFAWYGDFFSFAALFISLLVFGIQRQYAGINILLYPPLWLLNYVSFPFRFFMFKNWVPIKEPVGNTWKKLLAMVLIPFFFLCAFILVYATGSELFYSFISNFAIAENIIEWLLVACLGFFILFNLLFMWIPKTAIHLNSKLRNDFSEPARRSMQPTFSFLDINFERKSGEISLVLLNLLLVLFISIYNYEQFFSPLSSGSLSSEIHERVVTIIFSIVMAVGVIMLYFKSAFNFDPAARNLKKLALLWIVLNALLILSAITKNSEYIMNFGLTYKRIGVYIFLTLSLIGLALTFVKIQKRKTNLFLVSKMLWVFGATFIIMSWINFSWVVTRYNIALNKTEDIEYLQSLNYNKQILYDHFKDAPEWAAYFETHMASLATEKEKPLLSAALYYRFINWDQKNSELGFDNMPQFPVLFSCLPLPMLP